MKTKQKKSSTKASPKAASSAGTSVINKLTFSPLDKNSFTPLYFQIQTQLLLHIESGRLRPGDSLPGEEELTRIYGVSRMTCRQALQSLKNQGFANREKGRGTFVIQPKVEKDIAHLLGFSAEMEALGMKASSKVLGIATLSATPEIASKLAIEPGSPVVHIQRQRFANGEPVLAEEVWLSQQQYPGIEKLDFSRRSLYETLRERYGVRIGSADEVIEARSANRHEAALLGIAPRSSLLVISRTLLNVEGRPVETGISSYRGDRYRAVLRIPATAME